MATFGRFGKFPYRFGGEPSPQEKSFRALVSLEGAGMLPPDDPQGDKTIDGAWHQAMANGLGSIGAVGEAAVFQAWPNLATDLIGEYERILGISPPIDGSDQARRDVVTLAWVGDIQSNYPDMAVSLDGIDLRFSILNPNHTLARQTYFGKLFAGQVEPLIFHGTKTISDFPNYSDDFCVRVLFDVGDGVGAVGPIGIAKQRAKELSERVLPAWCDFSIALHRGFHLTHSLLTEASL